MTVALWCVIVAGVLPLFCAALAKGLGKGFDNSRPREWLAQQQGAPGRAHAAQQNSWEAFAFFSACVFAAHLAEGAQARIDALAIAFIAARLLYILCYVMDKATMRSILWVVGFALALAIFLVGV
jgi:uncharacterized MAPEG superfamily protein